MSKEIEHSGIVTKINKQIIQVEIMQQSACSACDAKKSCTMADAKQKTIDIENNNYNIKLGDEVIISGSSRIGYYAVFLAFAIPVFLIVAALLVGTALQLQEWISAIIAIASICIYFLILKIFNTKINNKLKFRIKL
ncbi:MAG: SoxR reducing system RseC family protein [Paludibacter sp.]|jgi:sigma-E factor negative regulatory protein RseC|nr:SoxR reducing system RseC family protein [Paludibacter sp.]